MFEERVKELQTSSSVKSSSKLVQALERHLSKYKDVVSTDVLAARRVNATYDPARTSLAYIKDAA
jgi:hypothetical protein